MTGEGTALTTGANTGIGLATVLELSRRGWRSVGSVRSESKAETVHAAAADAGVEVETILLDVTDAERSADVVDEVRPDVLVNNAGIPVTGAIEDLTDDDARLAFETMALAPMRLARLALPHMRERGEGRIITVSSIYGRVTTPLTGWYQAAKHAVEAASDALRMEIARDGLHVSLVQPGFIKTGLLDEAQEALNTHGDSRYLPAYARMRETMRLATPIMSEPAAVARTIAHVASARAPQRRYLVGADARTAALAERAMPPAIWDRVSRLVLRL